MDILCYGIADLVEDRNDQYDVSDALLYYTTFPPSWALLSSSSLFLQDFFVVPDLRLSYDTSVEIHSRKL